MSQSIPLSTSPIDGEEWRVTPRHPGYAVSSLGRVMRLAGGHGMKPGHILRQRLNSNGYPRVRWFTDGRDKEVLVHQLVCEAFHGPRPSPLHEAAHRNGIHSECSATNLSWKTRTENEADKLAHGTSPQGERNGRAKFVPETILAVRSAKGRQCDIARRFGMSEAHVSEIKSRRTWKHL